MPKSNVSLPPPVKSHSSPTRNPFLDREGGGILRNCDGHRVGRADRGHSGDGDGKEFVGNSHKNDTDNIASGSAGRSVGGNARRRRASVRSYSDHDQRANASTCGESSGTKRRRNQVNCQDSDEIKGEF